MLEHLLIVWPKIDGAVTGFYFCRGMRLYYWSGPVGALSTGQSLPNQLFEPRIIQSFSFRESCLSAGALVGGVTAYGTIRLADPYRELPFAADSTDWRDAPYLYLQGDPDWPLSDFAIVQRGFVARSMPVEQGGPAHELVLRDNLTVLAESAAPELYRGTGACLDFDGGDDRVEVADQPAIRISGNLTIAATIWPRTLAPGTIAGRGESAYRFWIEPDGSLNTLVTDGGDVFTRASSPGVVVGGGVRQDVATTISFEEFVCTIRWYVNAVQVGEAFVGPLDELAPAIGVPLNVGGLPAPINESLDGRMDEFQLWSKALIAEELESNRQREIPGDTPFLQVYLRFNEADGTDALDATPNAAHGVLINGPRWVGSGEGAPSLAGRHKPVGRGIIRHRELVWVDDVDQVGQFDSRPAEEVLEVTVGGVPSYTLNALVGDVYTAAPPSGTYDVDLEHGLIRFGGTRPDRTALVDFKADSRGGYVETTGAVARRLVEEAGVDVAAIDDGAFGAIDILHPGPVGVGANGDDVTYDDLVLRLLHGVYGWRCTDISGRVSVGALDLSGIVAGHLTGRLDLTLEGRDPTDVMQPVRRIDILYRRYERTLSRAELASDILSDSQIEDFGKEYRVLSSPTISTAKGAVPLTVTTCFDEEADARALLAILTPIFSSPRRSDTLTLARAQHGRGMGMLLEVTAPIPGYETGRTVAVVERDVNDETGVHRLGVFG